MSVAGLTTRPELLEMRQGYARSRYEVELRAAREQLAAAEALLASAQLAYAVGGAEQAR